MFSSASGAKMAEYVKDKWLVFKPDQTLEIYLNKQKIDGGRWAYDEEKDVIFLSCKDKAFNNSWRGPDARIATSWRAMPSGP